MHLKKEEEEASGEIILTVYVYDVCLLYGLEFDPDKWILTSFALVMLCG